MPYRHKHVEEYVNERLVPHFPQRPWWSVCGVSILRSRYSPQTRLSTPARWTTDGMICRVTGNECLPVCLCTTVVELSDSDFVAAKVPDSMKQALVTLLLKKDNLDPQVLKKYRPVSNLSFLSKVMERGVAVRLTNYMAINQLHEPMQSAFRACHTVIAQRQHLCGYRMTSFALSIRVGVLSLCNPILVLLSIQSITPSSYLRWSQFLESKDLLYSGFKKYLLGRKQRIKINDDFYENQEILWSVPQKSVLCALLFLIYMVILYFATLILVRTRIVQLILQFWYAPELFPANNSRTYQNCQKNSSNSSVPELLIQAILGRTRIVWECFTGQLNDADCQVLCRNNREVREEMSINEN